MKSRHLLGSIAFLCIGFILFALYLQHFNQVLPCPLCVLQRYAFVMLAVFCLVGAIAGTSKAASFLGFITAATGAGLAGYQLWVEAHPSISCGNDPLEKAINQLFTAKLFPFLFRSEGFCTDVYAPILGLTTPQWSLVWFVLFTLAMIWTLFRR